VQNRGHTDTFQLRPDLVEIVTTWPQLPEHIKAAIIALVDPCSEWERQRGSSHPDFCAVTRLLWRVQKKDGPAVPTTPLRRRL
jgi:hypothetical protein